MVPIAAITFNRETGKYGFRVWMPGRQPHDSMEVFESAADARNWIDPQCERVWDHPDAAGSPEIVLISRGYLPGSVPTRF